MSRAQTIFVIATLATIGGGALVWTLAWRTHPAVPVSTSEAFVSAIVGTRRWVDGAPLADGAVQPTAVAIVVDNAPEAQPQSGIADAPLVFEVPVEGRRTRLLAVYPTITSSGDADACTMCPPTYDGPIGPVRSARPYLTGLAQAVAAPLVHVGGSPAAMAIFRNGGWLHINQYFDPPFWRDAGRHAPSNVYTTVKDLSAFVRARGWEDHLRTAWATPWEFSDQAPPGAGAGDTIRLPFDHGPYVVEWTYDAQAGTYIRQQGGQPHRVRSGSGDRMISAKNVVVLRVRARILDAIGRLEISALEPPLQPVGVAPLPATVFTGGHRTDGTWDWNVGGQPRFQLLRSTGDPMTLQPGTTWVEFFDQN